VQIREVEAVRFKFVSRKGVELVLGVAGRSDRGRLRDSR